MVLQFALLLFGIALTTYLRDLDVSIAEVVLVVGYLCRLRLLRVHRRGRNHLGRLSVPDTPIRPASEAPTLGKEIHCSLSCLVEALKPRAVTLLHRRIKQLKRHGGLTDSLAHVFGIFLGGTTAPAPPAEDVFNADYQMTLSNPTF